MSVSPEYRRQLTEAALAHLGTAATASDVADAMVGLAEAEGAGHTVRNVTAQSVAHTLRAMERDGSAIVAGLRRNTRSGRDEPTWLATTGTNHLVPEAPADVEVPPPPLKLTPPTPREETPYDDMTREQLVLLLTTQDEMVLVAAEALKAITDVSAKMREARTRAVKRLAAAGLA